MTIITELKLEEMSEDRLKRVFEPMQYKQVQVSLSGIEVFSQRNNFVEGWKVK